MSAVRDLRPELGQIEAGLRQAGFRDSANALHSALSAAYTTSSEMLGEFGKALRQAERRAGPDLPAELKQQIDRCLREIRKTWPGLR